MSSKYTENLLGSTGRVKLIFLYAGLITTLVGCTFVVKMSYSPAYTEKRSLVESKISNDKPISVLLLPFDDKRHGIENPYFITKRVKLEKQPLSEYLYHALFEDLELIGFNVIQPSDKELNFKEIKLGKKTVNENIKYVLFVEVNECAPDAELTNYTVTAQLYSKYDFNIMVWDNKKSKIVHDGRIVKRVKGEETANPHYKEVMRKLLNEDLTIINVDIAEILVSLKSS